MPGLNSLQMEQLRRLLVSAGWNDVVKLAIQGKLDTCQKLAFLLPNERPEPYKGMDDHTATAILRGEVKALEWVLHAFENEVIVDNVNRRREELARLDTNGGQPADTQAANPL